MAKKTNKVKVDFSGVQEGSTFALIPIGSYEVEVKEAELTETKSGSEQLKLTYKIINNKEFKNQQVIDFFNLDPQWLANLYNAMVAMGMNPKKEIQDISTDAFIGRSMGITIKHTEGKGQNKGKIYANVASYHGGDEEDYTDEDTDVSEVLSELDIDDIKELAKSLKVKVSKKDTEDDIIEKLIDEIDEEAILDAYNSMFDDDEDTEEDEEDSDEEGEDIEEELRAMSDVDLRKVASELGIKKTKTMDKKELISRILKFDEEDIEGALLPFSDEEEGGDADYSDMSLDELREECDAREITWKKSEKEKALIKKLEEDDEE